MPKAIQTEFISHHHDNLLASDFSIKKTQKRLARKYYSLMLWLNIKAYVNSCSVCLALKTVKHKLDCNF